MRFHLSCSPRSDSIVLILVRCWVYLMPRTPARHGRYDGQVKDIIVTFGDGEPHCISLCPNVNAMEIISKQNILKQNRRQYYQLLKYQYIGRIKNI